MKVFVLSAMILAFIALASCNLSPEEENQVWNDYLLKYNIDLEQSVIRWGSVDDLKRTFIKHYNEIEEHNKLFSEGKVSYERGINEHSMLTYEQLSEIRFGYKPSRRPIGKTLPN